MTKEVKRAAKKFIRAAKGKTDLISITKYLDELGFCTIFFNTSDGDAELERFNKTETAQRSKAFTYCSTAKIVFIDGNLSAENKIIVALHELGHIVLKHVGNNTLHMRDKMLIDVEANAFAYEVLTAKRKYQYLS